MRVGIVLSLLTLGGCGSPTDVPADSVGGNGVILASVSETLPAETETLPPLPGEAVVTASCTACHSAAMITAQPPLTHEQWTATVKKMREVYKAPVADADVPAILAYLAALSDRQRLPAGAAATTAAAP